MCSDIPPEAIQAYLLPRRPTTRDLKHPRRDPQPLLRSHNLGTRNPLRQLPPLPLTHPAIPAVLGIDTCSLLTSTINQCFRSSEMSEEVPVAFEDVEFLAGGRFVVAAVGPGTRRSLSVACGELQRAERDAQVEVGEDELDGGEQERGEGDGEDGGVGLAGYDVPA